MGSPTPADLLRRHGIAINAARYDEEVTDSLVNVAARVPRSETDFALGRAQLRQALALREGWGSTPGWRILLEAFGRQQTTVTYSRRNRVWTFQRAGTAVWALASNEGIAWEWDRRGDAREGWRIRRDVEEALIEGRGVRVPTEREVGALLRAIGG